MTRSSSVVSLGLFSLVSGVEFLEGLELLDQSLVLVLQDGHPVLQALDVLLLLVPALPGRLPIFQQPDFPFSRRVFAGYQSANPARRTDA